MAEYSKERQKQRAAAVARYYANNPGAAAHISAKSNDKIKDEVFGHYGGCCLICGEDDYDVLAIDHINQDGAAHRRETGVGRNGTIYRWLKRNNYPPGFRLLCYNCNIKAFRIYQRSKRGNAACQNKSK